MRTGPLAISGGVEGGCAGVKRGGLARAALVISLVDEIGNEECRHFKVTHTKQLITSLLGFHAACPARIPPPPHT